MKPQFWDLGRWRSGNGTASVAADHPSVAAAVCCDQVRPSRLCISQPLAPVRTGSGLDRMACGDEPHPFRSEAAALIRARAIGSAPSLHRRCRRQRAATTTWPRQTRVPCDELAFRTSSPPETAVPHHLLRSLPRNVAHAGVTSRHVGVTSRTGRHQWAIVQEGGDQQSQASTMCAMAEG